MSGRDMMYRNVLRGGQFESPQITSEMSPMSNLALSLHGTCLSHTPRKRLSLSSNLSDTPQSCHNTPQSCHNTSHQSLNMLHDSNSSDSGSSFIEESSISPRRPPLSRNKENFPSPYYSPSRSSAAGPLRSRISPLQDAQYLDLSPLKSRVAVSHMKSATCVSIYTAATSTPVSSSSLAEGSRPFRKFSSLIKGDEDDAMLRDLMEEETSQEGHRTGLSNLLSAPIQPRSEESRISVPSPTPPGRPSIRRCLSMVDTTPTSSRVLSVTRGSPVQIKSSSTFKRRDPPCDFSSGNSDCKRRKLDEPCEQLSPLTSNARTTQRQVSAPQPSTNTQTIKPKIMRSHSESHVSIMKALNRSSGHGDFIGDFSKPWLLPTLDGGKHPDLKSISVDTLAEVVKGKYDSQLGSCRIIDCRYPYEFEGGHILLAEMWHHPEMVAANMKAQKGSPVISSDEVQRHILIFHCEFSAERGPKAQRLLREMDRTANKEHYPALHFPEMYLLEGGYKAFYEVYPELCTPNDYIRMLDANHTEDLKHFRGKSKSWAVENKQSKSRNALPRPGLKRLGL